MVVNVVFNMGAICFFFFGQGLLDPPKRTPREMARMLAAVPPAFAPLSAHTPCAPGVAREGFSRTVLVPAAAVLLPPLHSGSLQIIWLAISRLCAEL